jgi:hypothetical protein
LSGLVSAVLRVPALIVLSAAVRRINNKAELYFTMRESE